MEIEKKRETSWKIQLKKNNENIEITSVEISGEVRQIKIALLNDNKSVKVKMNKEEFYNFLSLLSAFKDVVIGEESIIINDELSLIENNTKQAAGTSSLVIQDVYQLSPESFIESKKDEDEEELDPEEWDPW